MLLQRILKLSHKNQTKFIRIQQQFNTDKNPLEYVKEIFKINKLLRNLGADNRLFSAYYDRVFVVFS